nr:unnamed protein product [Callosobruchus chinensis]
MLACVCQPADPSVFRRSPVPLGAPPLTARGPGRGVRVVNERPEVVVSAPPTSKDTPRTASLSKGTPSNAVTGQREEEASKRLAKELLIDFGQKEEEEKTVASDKPDSSSSSAQCSTVALGFSAVKQKCAKKCKNKRKHDKKQQQCNYFKKSGDSNAGGSTSCDEDKTKAQSATELEKLPPDGVHLSVSELRDMACRQQAQIEQQHRLLAAKEQRLRYLKEQEARQRRVHAEGERLRRLRERVDAQELKLRKLRALRGQVDHQKQNNISLTSDLDSIRALFNEKEKELSLAVAKVEELTRQLEELRRGRNDREPPPASALELDKLRRELMYRNKLNEQQNQRLYQQREALTARQEEMTAIDKRISELQERLHRKRLLNQQLASQISAASHKAAYHQLVRLTGNAEQNNQAFARKQQQNNQSNGLSRGNIAAVEPYNHVPLQSSHQVKNFNCQENPTYHPSYQQNHNIKQDEPNSNGNHEHQDLTKKMANLYVPRTDENDALKNFSVSKNDPKYQTLPYNTKFTVNLLTSRLKSENQCNNNDLSKEDLNSVHQQQQHISNGTNYQMQMTVHSAPLSMVNKNIATPLNQHDLLARKNSNEVKDQINRENAYPGVIGGSSATTTYHKPISSVAPTSIQHSGMPSAVYQTSSIKVQPVEPQTLPPATAPKGVLPSSVVQSPPQTGVPLSPPQSTSTPLNSTPVTGGTSPEGPEKSPKPALPPKPAIKPPPRQTQILSEECPPPPLPLTDPPDDKNAAALKNSATNQKQGTFSHPPPVSQSNSEMFIKAKPLTLKKQLLNEQPKLRSSNSHSKLNGLTGNSRGRMEMPQTFTYPEVQSSVEKPPENQENIQSERDETDKASSIEESSEKEERPPVDGVVRRCKKGNLKQTGKTTLARRVSFDPLALLLDASLEGELELVKKTAAQVPNPSAANDEGITALHNAICAGHLDIVRFLVEWGCDVNAQDSDGWTPLHCAASCNNLAMVKFLVEHGACIFATTLSDRETAAEKCEEDEEGFDGCSEYLYSVQEKLGILSGGVVYAVFDYTAQQPDELSFKEGQQLTVLRKGDENEREWWWSKLGDKEGYVPRNLLGLYPRVTKSED